MIKFLDLHKINARFESEFHARFQHFLKVGRYILDDEVAQFESSFATYCGTKFCIGTANGLDALTLIFKSYIQLGALQPGDEVIAPANTYIASILAVINAGLTPVLVEPHPETYNISVEAINQYLTAKTKAVLVVHLYGQLADIEAVNQLAKERQLLVIEDAAQAHGALLPINISAGKPLKAGNLGNAAAFSFYPSKNLGAMGDAGAVTTNDAQLASVLKMMRNYGSPQKHVNDIIGFNSRLDELQAVFLNIKLRRLDIDNEERRRIAMRYLREIKNKKINLPKYTGTPDHVFHVFVVRVADRSAFFAYLKANGVECAVHYPLAPHQQKALAPYRLSNFPITEAIHKSVVSIPISPVMTDDEVTMVIKILNLY